jgi:hypothetical protein
VRVVNAPILVRRLTTPFLFTFASFLFRDDLVAGNVDSIDDDNLKVGAKYDNFDDFATAFPEKNVVSCLVGHSISIEMTYWTSKY